MAAYYRVEIEKICLKVRANNAQDAIQNAMASSADEMIVRVEFIENSHYSDHLNPNDP